MTKTTATVVFDLETTGFNPMPLMSNYHKVVQISAKLLETNEFFNSFVNPEQEISQWSMNIHKITNSDVEFAPIFKQVVINMWKSLKLDNYDSIIMIAHNCDFFDKVIFMKEYGNAIDASKIIFWDTLPWLRENINMVIKESKLGRYNNENIFKLEHLYQLFYDKPLANAHRADADVDALSMIYKDFIKPYLEKSVSNPKNQLLKKIRAELISSVKYIGPYRSNLIFVHLGISSLIDLKAYFKNKEPKSLDIFLIKVLGMSNVTQRMMIICQILDKNMWDRDLIETFMVRKMKEKDCIDCVDYFVKYRFKVRTQNYNTCLYDRGLMRIKNKES